MLTYIYFSLTIAFSQFSLNEWGSITSLLTPNKVEISDDAYIYSATSGGLLQFDMQTKMFNAIKMEEGLVYLDLIDLKIDRYGNIWLAGSYPNGLLQIYRPNVGIIKIIDHLEISEIKFLEIGSYKAYVAYSGLKSNDLGILEFEIDENGLPSYKDYFVNFLSADISKIRDLDFISDSLLFITTDKGVFKGNIKDNLKSSINWSLVYTNLDAQKYINYDLNGTIVEYVISDSVVLFKQNNDWIQIYDFFNQWPYCEHRNKNSELVDCPSPKSIEFCSNYIEDDQEVVDLGSCGPNVVSATFNGIELEILLDYFYKKINTNGIEEYSFSMPYSEWSEFKTKFTSFSNKFDRVIFGMQNYGILLLEDDSYNLYAPNTSHTNEFHALEITSNGALAAVSNEGIMMAKRNLNGSIKDRNGMVYHNLISYPDYKLFPKNYEQDLFFNKTMLYHSGKINTYSIINKNDGNLIFGNSYLRSEESWYDFPALIDLDINTYEFTAYDTANQVIDGYWGIATELYNMNMRINQIAKDNDGDIWVTNPYCERYGNMLAIQSSVDQTWSHISIPDSSSFRPVAIDFDNSNKAWIGFIYDVLNDGRIYSNGGIKIFNQYSNSWVPISNLDKLPGNDSNASVWSLVFDNLDYLWVMNEKGIRYYEQYSYNSTSNTIEIKPYVDGNGTPIDILPQLSYIKGNKIKVDSQNNKWIITHQGVWVIQESTEFWPSKAGLNTENSNLLSNLVYDVAFDNKNGLAYLATDKGISILHVPFSENPSKKESIYISPNPFIIPDKQGAIIKNIPSGARLKIITISGKLIKDIQLNSNQSQYIWDGTNIYGESVGTAIYIISTFKTDEPNKVAKIAVIRK